MNYDEILIDINQVLRDKMGDKNVRLPSVIIKLLKRIIHQKEINDLIISGKGKRGHEFCEHVLESLDIKLSVKGEDNFPDTYTNVFVSNHPLGGPDGLALAMLLGNRYEGRIKLLVNDLLMSIKVLAPLFVPVNKTGAQSRVLPDLVNNTFCSDNNILMFPAGLCSRRIKGVIKDLPWSKTFVTKSMQFKRDIIPIRFEGANSDFFYRLANINKAIGLKFNVAMLFLADEMFKKRGETFNVTIGKPLSWRFFDNSKSASDWAKYVQNIIYSL
ncbi:MAG TPA: 1-acyl-sn-glycerol-3-phosphate acyltransferase [Bacteroidaceae bacterium]|nr:1-acyl-sn-glycerol-3-phosphate acyltransferase [Bacteroidaceae bacterium]